MPTRSRKLSTKKKHLKMRLKTKRLTKRLLSKKTRKNRFRKTRRHRKGGDAEKKPVGSIESPPACMPDKTQQQLAELTELVKNVASLSSTTLETIIGSNRPPNDDDDDL